jgi:hypothetical protein
MRVLRILHRWLGLIVGVQILLWTASGLVFAWLDHGDVQAEDKVRTPPVRRLHRDIAFAEPRDWLHEYRGAAIVDITLAPLLDLDVYRIRLNDRTELRRAEDGTRLVIDEAFARRLAEAHYAGGGALRGVSLHASPTIEARDAGAVWEAAYDDPERTSLYFSAADGRLVAVRGDAWRLFDVFWMLHTMDYRGRDDFNHPLVILATTGALWLGISGVFLLIQAFRR